MYKLYITLINCTGKKTRTDEYNPLPPKKIQDWCFKELLYITDLLRPPNYFEHLKFCNFGSTEHLEKLKLSVLSLKLCSYRNDFV